MKWYEIGKWYEKLEWYEIGKWARDSELRRLVTQAGTPQTARPGNCVVGMCMYLLVSVGIVSAAAPSRCGSGPSGPEPSRSGWLINQLGNPSFFICMHLLVSCQYMHVCVAITRQLHQKCLRMKYMYVHVYECICGYALCICMYVFVCVGILIPYS